MTGNGKNGAAVLHALLGQAPAWAVEAGPVDHTILSSRTRFARNLAAMPFPARMTPEQQRSVVARVRRAAEDLAILHGSPYLALEEMAEEDLEILVERRLVSRDLVRGGRLRGVLVGSGEHLTIMVNEEDHLRLQSVASGLRLGETLDRLNEVDDFLDGSLDYAFDDALGYLTACPTNAGTGIRVSVLAHLPALILTKRAKKVIHGVTSMGFAVRGFYGEGTEVRGNFFQISNQTTLGKNEHDITSRLEQTVRRIIGFEEEARDVIWGGARLQLEDKIYRAYGTLQNARSISAEEVVSLASAVRFGIALELGGLCTLAALNEILIFSQPGHIRGRAARELDQEERRRLRADYVRARLAEGGREPLGGGSGTSAQHPSPGPD
jgi:protein arginine kinase